MTVRTDLIIGLATLAACGLLWFVMIDAYAPGAEQGLFPRVIVVWLAIFAALLTGLSLWTLYGRGSPAAPEQQPEADAAKTEPPRLAFVFGLIVLWIPYVILIGHLGFYLSALLMLVPSMLYLGVRDWRRLVATPALALGLIYLVFEEGLNLVLPRGFW